MTCEHAREQFSALIDDVLSPDERAACEHHMVECAACAREWQRFKQSVTIVRTLGPVRAPVGFVDRVMQAARPRPWYWRIARWLVFPLSVKLPLEVATLLLVGISAVYVFRHLPEQQQGMRPEVRSRVARPQTARSVTPPPHVAPSPTPSSPPPIADKATPSTAPPVSIESPKRSERALSRAAPQARAKESTSQLSARSYARGADVPGAWGNLVVPDPQRALNDVADVLARLGGVLVSQSIRGDEIMVEARVPGQAYPAFAAALEKLGTWTPRDVPTSPPQTLFITLRIIR